MAFLLAGILLVLAGILYVMIENQKVIVANQEMMIENQNESLGYQRADEADPVTPTEAPTTMESPEPSITTTTAPPTTTTTAPPTTTTTAPPTTTTTAPPTITYVLRVTLFSEQNLRELSSYDCREVISVGGNYDDVPSATYSLVDQTNNIIGILLPEVATVNTCTFEFVGDFVSVPDLMLIRGPRMQQNGFPVRSEDFFIDEVGRVVIAELSLSVRS
ncbi:MAG: hypothetical protein OXJ55_17310 [Caldilineaceae bacterium]|nr:hypothetical protein [Caldilineaceae bacterium]